MTQRRIEGSFSQGWGVAAFITLLAVSAFVGAGMYKKATYRSPNDPLAPSMERAPAHEAASAEHGASEPATPAKH